MIKGIGTDIVAVSRIKENIHRYGNRFLDRIYTIKEQEYCSKYKEPSLNFAARFAAKEAVAKAFGTGFTQGLGWLDIEIINDENGKPVIFLSQKAKDSFGTPLIHLSMSHSDEYATAFVVIEVNPSATSS